MSLKGRKTKVDFWRNGRQIFSLKIARAKRQPAQQAFPVELQHRVERRCVCRQNIKTLKKWVILIALQFRYTFQRPQTKRLRARKIGFVPQSPFGRQPSVSLRATFRAPARIWLAVIDFQNGEQQSRSGSDKKRRNRLQQIHKDPIGLINRAKRQVQTFFKVRL